MAKLKTREEYEAELQQVKEQPLELRGGARAKVYRDYIASLEAANATLTAENRELRIGNEELNIKNNQLGELCDNYHNKLNRLVGEFRQLEEQSFSTKKRKRDNMNEPKMLYDTQKEKLKEFKENVCKFCKLPRCTPDMIIECKDSVYLLRCKNYKGEKS